MKTGHPKHGFYLEDLAVGMTANRSHTFSKEDVLSFVDLSGDDNPIHTDEDFAASTVFKQPIVHGMLVGSLISTIFGKDFPGPGTIYLEQNMKFKAPVNFGDTVTAEVCITEIIPEKRRVFFTTQCKVAGKLVVDGNATLMVDRRADLQD